MAGPHVLSDALLELLQGIEIAAFVARWARDNGLEAEVLEQTPGRPSVVVTARGSGGGRTLLLCGHLDTVNVEGMADPHTPRIDGDRLHGRGAYDMKAGLAMAIIAMRVVTAVLPLAWPMVSGWAMRGIANRAMMK
jgi:acetylornithine deacetylase/succinyl-diaminopimelate desuccinylase-like protein